MEQTYKPTSAELIEVRNIKIVHAIFLKLIEEELIQVTENNKIIFRRNPDSRLKTTKSILKKFHKRKNKSKDLISFVKELNDIGGLRMTITTKDEFELAKKILLTSVGLKKFGELDTESRVENGIMNERGYAAHHYYLRYTIDMNDEDKHVRDVIEETLERAKVNRNDLAQQYSVIVEIQVRTLAQDLWAVFEHPERYKGNGEIPETLNTELLNYAKLMDVADDIAQLTKNRKVHEAENFSRKKRNVPIDSKELLTIDVLRRELNRMNTASKNEGSILTSTFDLCDLLMQLADNGIFTCEDLLSLIYNKEYIEEIESAFKFLNIKREEMEMTIADSFQLFFICRICQTECENLKSKRGDQKKAIEQRLEERMNELVRKISEIKSESDLAAVINNYEVR